MKIKKCLTLGVCLAGLTIAGMAQESTVPKVVPIKPNAAFERLKALAGEWEGTNGRGLPARLTYRVTSQGTMLLETLASKEQDGKEVEMMTAYHVDGDRLMMTHYCVNTQPRMVAVSVSGNTIHFTRKDVTNYPGAPYGAMRAMKLTP